MAIDDSIEPPLSVRVDIDTLEYTRSGLRTREPLVLQTAQRHQIVVVRPPLRPSLAPGARGFPHDSAYPLLATLSTVWSLAPVGTSFTHHRDSAAADAKTAFQVFGHTSVSGDAEYNKQLSDRRAKVGLALLTSDAESLAEVADADGWGIREMQAMLRTLHCDPGPVDDELGVRTESAIAQFQERYGSGVYHRRHGRQPGQVVEVDGRWNDATKTALFDAFVHGHGAAVPVRDIHPSHPANGCSEFNTWVADGGPQNRRLTIIAHPRLPPHHANAPCTEGDEGSCPVVEGREPSCMWFRDHVAESAETPVVFVDPRWMWLGDDRYLLSALTNIASDDEVQFEVFDAEDRLYGDAEADGARLQSPQSTVLQGVVWRGVAQVVWKSGTAFGAEDGRPGFERFPVFRVRDPASEAYSFGPWPERQTLRLVVSSVDADSVRDRPVVYRLEAGDGSYTAEVSLADAVPASSHHVAVEFPDVPLDARVTLSVGAGGKWALHLFSNLVANALPGNCTSGDQCRELPVPQPPPDLPVPQEIDDDEDESNPWLDGDDSQFDEPSFV